VRPEGRSNTLLAITRSKAKMYEYDVPQEHHIAVKGNPAKLFDLTIGLLGDLSAAINNRSSLELIEDLKKNLRFSAYFFDAYLSARFSTKLDQYLLLIGSAAYYLSDLPGSSSVLLNRLKMAELDIDSRGLESLLFWILQGGFYRGAQVKNSLYSDYISNISDSIMNFFNAEEVNSEILLKGLRNLAYQAGTQRELLLADIIYATCKKRIADSALICLPQYSDIPVEQWEPIIQRESFIKQLWPGQKLLGEQNVYKGASAVIQLPTSAGKTKAIELIIRSALLSKRTDLAVVVAPFKALCHEIHNSLTNHFKDDDVFVDELTDVIQKDFSLDEIYSQKQIIVVTPEKLNYILRYAPEIIERIKLIIFDEAHLFDDGTRGVAYELLLSMLKLRLPGETQYVLISAVINNAKDIEEWLSDGLGAVIQGEKLIPTYRTIAFTSWQRPLGMLRFVNSEAPEREDFFVPRVISQYELRLKKSEKKPKLFPEKENGSDIALFLSLKLVKNGSVAIFIGRKSSASSLCKNLVDKYDRGLAIPPPSVFSSKEELDKLIYIHSVNFGAEATITKTAALGVFLHHGNIPQGIRLAVEYALQREKIKLVICTSTLAQGVNLPLRYLIIANARQGRDIIKTRDFHNLLGRAGRSGMYTEGSIIFADPHIFDLKSSRKEGWRWEEALKLLDPNNSESCSSYILDLFKPLHSDNIWNQATIDLDAVDFVAMYVKDLDRLFKMPERIFKKYEHLHFTINGLRSQIASKVAIITAIESYLLANLNLPKMEGESTESKAEALLEETLAFSQATEEQEESLKKIITLIVDNIYETEKNEDKRKIYGQTLYGIKDCQFIEQWITENFDKLVVCGEDEEFVELLWPLFCHFIDNPSFKGCSSEDALKQLVLQWLLGTPFYTLLEQLEDSKIGSRIPTIEHVVDICENAVGFQGALVLGAISQFLEFSTAEGHSEVVECLNGFQKRMKYGLPTALEVVIFELGFVDRPLALELGKMIPGAKLQKYRVKKALLANDQSVRIELRKYPEYFGGIWNMISGGLDEE